MPFGSDVLLFHGSSSSATAMPRLVLTLNTSRRTPLEPVPSPLPPYAPPGAVLTFSDSGVEVTCDGGEASQHSGVSCVAGAHTLIWWDVVRAAESGLLDGYVYCMLYAASIPPSLPPSLLTIGCRCLHRTVKGLLNPAGRAIGQYIATDAETTAGRNGVRVGDGYECDVAWRDTTFHYVT